MSNFDYKKYLVENKLTAGSRLNENVDTLQWPDAIRNFITTNLSSDEKELYLVVKALEKTLESFKNEMGEFDPDFHYVNENESTLPSENEIGEMATLIKKSSSLENEKSLQVDDLIMWNELDYSNDRGMGATGILTVGKVVKILGPANVQAEDIKTGDLYKVSRRELTKVPSVGDKIEATLFYNRGAGSGSSGSNKISGIITKVDLGNMKVAIKTEDSDKPLVASLEDLKNMKVF